MSNITPAAQAQLREQGYAPRFAIYGPPASGNSRHAEAYASRERAKGFLTIIEEDVVHAGRTGVRVWVKR